MALLDSVCLAVWGPRENELLAVSVTSHPGESHTYWLEVGLSGVWGYSQDVSPAVPFERAPGIGFLSRLVFWGISGSRPMALQSSSVLMFHDGSDR